MAATDSTDWQFTSSKLPKNVELLATISNGFLGTRLFSDTVYAAGVFNGDHLKSHRARIPSSLSVNITIEGLQEDDSSKEKEARTYTLNAAKGYFVQSLDYLNGEVTIEQKVFAHRKFRNLLITETKARTSRKEGITIQLQNDMGERSDDINFKYEKQEDYNILNGFTNVTEASDVSMVEVAVAYFPDDTIKLAVPSSGQWHTYYGVTAICSSLETKNPKAKAIADFLNARKLILEDYQSFWDSHVTEWEELWINGTIEVTGNLKLAQAVNSSMYYILSSLQSSWPHGLSPGGLPSNGYLGHTFWDQETWMYPTILMFHQDMARSCLQYRYERMGAASKRAESAGYKGLMFPWESACSGIEVCPEPYPYSTFEHHVVGDIGFAVQQYWMATHDSSWFQTQGKPLLQGVAEFWESRVAFDKTKNAFSINHVQGPDEYHYDVNNSVYTNVIAKINLEFAIYLFGKFKIDVPESWKDIAAQMYIPFDEENQYHPEFDGYKMKTVVKQADTILLGFPLMFEMPESVRENDLRIYEEVTDKNGPAMTKSMFAVGWIDLKKLEMASVSFKEGYANITEPFKVWTETPDGGEVNFITGAGGFLQSMVFGYGGIRLKMDGLYLDPVLPDETQHLGFYGITYLGNKINYTFDSENTTVVVTKEFATREKLVLVTGSKTFSLGVGFPCSFANAKAVIKPAESAL